jgi:hypothetical protein
MAVRFRPFDADFLQQPYPTYARLRDEDPVHRIRFSPVAVGRMIWRFARERMRQSDEGFLPTLRNMRREMQAQQQRSGRRFGRGQKFYALSRYEDVSDAASGAARSSMRCPATKTSRTPSVTQSCSRVLPWAGPRRGPSTTGATSRPRPAR